ncbi:HTH CENPB-type domain-containing protein [Citrus sinensis]|uniref:HTH CENPB-type domain-containing protein n=1 Tax=Citrus sinensis TaxID=2711 RepID=A0ACB8JSN9_CITSI|nr:HTH CENPB-type domain-containing protein [Citrus sinensis]
MPPKDNKRTHLTENIRVELRKIKESNPNWKQKDLVKWLEETHANLLKEEVPLNPNAKCSKTVKYPAMESVLYEWFVGHQEHVNISGEQLYLEATSFEFSYGWLEKFKQQHAIHSFRHFRENGSVDMEKIKASLPPIKEELDKWACKDIYNMDETCLFYRMQVDNSLATKQLEGRKQTKERVTIVICCNGDGSDKLLLWIISKFFNSRCFKNVNCGNLNCKYRANSNAWMICLLHMHASD